MAENKNNETKEQLLSELEWEIDTRSRRQKLEIPVATLGAFTTALMLVVPLIIYDILGAGAYYFESHARSLVNISAAAGGNSVATFWFGLIYFFSHTGGGQFIPQQLFSAQWMALQAIKSDSIPAAYSTLGSVTMVLTVLLFATAVVSLVLYIADRHSSKSALHKAVKYFSLSAFCIQAVTAVWFFIIVLGLCLKIEPTGQIYNMQDFMVYGGVKMTIECVFAAAMAVLNILLFWTIKKKPNE